MVCYSNGDMKGGLWCVILLGVGGEEDWWGWTGSLGESWFGVDEVISRLPLHLIIPSSLFFGIVPLDWFPNLLATLFFLPLSPKSRIFLVISYSWERLSKRGRVNWVVSLFNRWMKWSKIVKLMHKMKFVRLLIQDSDSAEGFEHPDGHVQVESSHLRRRSTRTGRSAIPRSHWRWTIGCGQAGSCQGKKWWEIEERKEFKSILIPD